MKNNFNIKEFLNLNNYATDDRVARRKSNDKLTISNTNEFFTPFEIVKKMADKVSLRQWKNADLDMLEPSFGNGQFVVYIIYNKIMHGSTWRQALEHTWGTELMKDNVKETHDRVIKLLKAIDVPRFDEKKAREIMKNNLVQTDFFEWSFEYWCPIKDIPAEELQKSSQAVKEAVEQYYKKQKIESIELF